MKPGHLTRKQLAACGLVGAAALIGGVVFFLQPRTLAEESGKPAPASKQPPQGNWIRGDTDEKFALVAKHLRGFDMTMFETGHRYIDLYWAGKDGNWEFAAYQLDKILQTVELGIERRPPRGASAQPFLKTAVPQLKEAIVAKDGALFEQRFTALTAHCNACHAMEKMAFVRVKIPETRVSPVGP
ncbi:MAG: hypothetical protein HY736_07095 [Verrucomicrobia bacterium]|nr:hypothetical protein [Verrucomicrobiota bacterium]